MRTGILGGTFNPVHMGHVLLADAAARELRLDRILLIPAGIPPHKQAPELATDCHRLAMCRLAAAQIRGGQVSDLELRRGGKSYTCRTLEILKAQYPADTLYWICGGDMFLTLQDWKQPEVIFQLAVICAAARQGISHAQMQAQQTRLEAMGASVQLLEVSLPPWSSTDIRRRIVAGQPVDGILPESVAAYIEDNRLYQK